MKKILIMTLFLLWTGFFFATEQSSLFCNEYVKVGAERLTEYLPQLKGKQVGVVGNQSSMVGNVHLVDTLLSHKIKVVRIFSPEHGFRGKADAGEKVKSGVDSKTGISIVSLYGKNKKPNAKQLEGIEIMVFDIQDVGVRFYTYISTLHYVMEACAENNIELIILDRPNPNGHYVDGPVLDLAYKSFVGMHEVPVVHGMTIGEYGKMINGENWLGKNVKCNLSVITCLGWDHTKFYKLPTKPSPNLPNMLSIYLYPSICFFEGTVVSVGRGTDFPFQVMGHPLYETTSFSFRPKPNEGAKTPKLNGEECYGVDFTAAGLNVIQNQKEIQIQWLIHFYASLNMQSKFFLPNNFINLLAGTNQLKKQLIEGKSETEIRESWQESLDQFKLKRKGYLLYKDFE